MSRKWFWKPVVVGIIVFTLIGCFFSAFILVLFNCPGLGSACLAHFPTILNDFLSIGWIPILIGGAAGAILGALYAWIRRWIQKNRVAAKRSG